MTEVLRHDGRRDTAVAGMTKPSKQKGKTSEQRGSKAEEERKVNLSFVLYTHKTTS